jgi:putative transposase
LFKAYKYRLYPTPDQQRQIDATIGVCRFVYNLALQVKITAYTEYGVSLSRFDIQQEVKELRSEYSWIAAVDANAIYASIGKMDSAFKKFFAGAGFPKYKNKNGRQSFSCYNNVRRVNWATGTLTVTKIKDIPIVLSQKFYGKIKTVTISRTTTGKYFASILVDDGNELPIKPPITDAIGIDLGLTHFAILNSGEKIDNPRHLRKSLDRLKVLQCRASRKKKGSANRRRANKKVAVLHEKIANQRQDFLHKLSTKIVRDNQAVCVEDLAVKNMVQNHKLAQAISDVSWSEFVRQLQYKCDWYGKHFIKIGRFEATTKTCNTCGFVNQELTLKDREWKCSVCGTDHDRDINAARNIRNSGLGKPVEPLESLAIAGAMKEETDVNHNGSYIRR